MFLEFTPVTLTHSPAEEAASLELPPLSTRIAWPLYGGLLAVNAAGGGDEATLFVCDKLNQPAAASAPDSEMPLIRTVVHEQAAVAHKRELRGPGMEPRALSLPAPPRRLSRPSPPSASGPMARCQVLVTGGGESNA